MTHVVSPICGFRLLARDFNTPPADHLFSEYSTIDWFEPLTYLASAEQVQTFYPSGRIERDDEASIGSTPADGGRFTEIPSAQSYSLMFPLRMSWRTTTCTTATN